MNFRLTPFIEKNTLILRFLFTPHDRFKKHQKRLNFSLLQ